MSDCKIKICGVTREGDVELVSNSGADFIGLLVDMPSPRTLDADRAAELARLASISVILLFFDKPQEETAGIIERVAPAGVQLQGHETPETVAWLRGRLSCPIWKGVHLPASGTGEINIDAALLRISAYKDAGADIALLDTVVKSADGAVRMGGTGKTFDWASAAKIAAKSPLPVMLAGGLKHENVAEAIRTVKPWGVDLASGVESAPGIKDPEKVRLFVKNVRDC